MPGLSEFLLFHQYGKKIAFVEQSLYRTRRYSYNDVAEGMLRVASRLREHGLTKGDRVLLWGENSARWAITFYGCVLSGCVVVPIDAGFSETFVQRIHKATEAKLVCSDRDSPAWDDLLQKRPAKDFHPPPKAAEDLVEIIYTSGTTAEPKGVMITQENLLSNLVPVQKEINKYRKYAIPFSPLGFVHLIPLSHLFGQIMGLFIPQMLGGKVIFTDPAAPRVARATKNNRASVIVCVPRELQLISSYVKKKHDPRIPDEVPKGVAGRLKRWWMFRSIHRELGWKFWAFVLGGATLPQEEELFWTHLGYVVIQGYGLTETAPSVTITHPMNIKRGAVGKTLPGIEVKLAEDGEILVRGPNVSKGYYGNEAATREAFREGWFHTGDLGKFDAEGNLILLGRKKEMIVTPEGLNVFPQEVEEVLNQDSRVKESAIISRAEAPIHAVVVPAPGVSEEQFPGVIAEANKKLERHQAIRSFSIWPGPKLPRTTTGKLKRNLIVAGVSGDQSPEMRTESLAAKILSGQSLDLSALSSLDRLELMMELEQTSGVTLDETAFVRAKNATDIARLVRSETPAEGVPRTSWRWASMFPTRIFRNIILYALVFPAMYRRIKVRASGFENLEKLEPPILFVANHQSIIDVPVILKALPSRFRLKLAPAMGTGAGTTALFASGLFFNAYPLPSTASGLRDALRHSGELVDRGFSPLVFPEGTRTPDGQLHPFRPGIGVIAQHLKLPVIPIWLQGAYEIWPIHARGPSKGIVTVRFGPPYHPGGKDPAAITAELESWFKQQTIL